MQVFLSLLPLLAVLANAAPTVPKLSYDAIIVFGDSLSDNGNGTFKLTNRTWPADPAYYNGRFANGPTWVEYVARAVLPFKKRVLDAGLYDEAYGGATLDNVRVQGYTGAKSDGECIVGLLH